jgi:DNA repair protein RAD50
LNAQKASLEQKRAYAQNQSRELTSKAQTLQTKLSGLDADTGKKTLVEQELQEKTSQLGRAREELERGDFEQKIQAEQDKLRERERKKELVTEELYQATRNADDRARLSIMSQNVENRQKALDSLVIATKDKLDAVIGLHWSPDNVESEMSTVLESV